MPPRKIKKDQDVERVVDSLEEPLHELIAELRAKLLAAAKSTAKSEAKRVLDTIPQKYHNMPISEYLNDPPVDFFGALTVADNESEEEVENEHEKENPQQAEVNDVEMDIDDAAHETSIPIAPSRRNSGRNTAAETDRQEIITPGGQAIPVPKLNPFKPFRSAYIDEQFAFSVNGSPMVLAGNGDGEKIRSTIKQNANKNTTAESGLLVPKEEDVGTSV